MSDQAAGMIRDSDIKWECRLLLKAIGIMQLPKELEQELIEPISRILKIENERLDKLTKGTDLAASDRKANNSAANPPTLPTPTENTDIEGFHPTYCDKYEALRGVYPNDRRLTGKPCSCGFEAAIEQKLNEARIKEAGLWLDMVVRHDSSRLDSNEWYKLNPQDVLKFHAERLKALQASKEGK
jgi:hypothetical protein